MCTTALGLGEMGENGLGRWAVLSGIDCCALEELSEVDGADDASPLFGLGKGFDECWGVGEGEDDSGMISFPFDDIAL